MAIQATKKETTRFNGLFVISFILVLISPALLTTYFGLSVHTIMSGSMKPTMKPGDEIIADVVPANQIHVGDVVLYLNPQSWAMTAHRVIKKTQDGQGVKLTMKGDANPIADPEVGFAAVQPVRKVIYTVPRVGYLLNSLSSTLVKGFGVMIFILIGLTLYFKTRRQELSPAAFPTNRSRHDDELVQARRLLEQDRLEQMKRFIDN